MILFLIQKLNYTCIVVILSTNSNNMLSGKQFKNIYSDDFYKVMNHHMLQYGFQYKKGINHDINQFKPSNSIGGLHFTLLEYIGDFCGCGDILVRIIIHDTAQVYIDDNWFKADFLEIGDSVKLEEIYKYKILDYRLIKFLDYPPRDLCMKAIEKNPYNIRYIKNPDLNLCLSVCKIDGLKIKYINNPTMIVRFEAVKNDGMALEFIEFQTEIICLEAVKNNGLALEFVKKQTEQICFQAITSHWYALKYVKKKTFELCLMACQKDKAAFQFIKQKYYFGIKNMLIST